MGTVIVSIIVFGIIALAAYKVYKDRQAGKGCGYGCENCSGCPYHAEVDSKKTHQ